MYGASALNPSVEKSDRMSCVEAWPIKVVTQSSDHLRSLLRCKPVSWWIELAAVA